MADTSPVFIGSIQRQTGQRTMKFAGSGLCRAGEVGPRLGPFREVGSAFLLAVLESHLDLIRLSEVDQLSLEQGGARLSIPAGVGCGHLRRRQARFDVGDLQDYGVGPAAIRIEPLRTVSRDVEALVI